MGELIHLCGHFTLVVDGDRRDASLPGRQGRRLLAYLVVTRARPVGRAELVDAIWGDGPPSAPEAGLSALLSKVRRCVGAHAIQGLDPIRLVLAPDAQVDLEVALEAAHRAESVLMRGDVALAYGPAQAAARIAERGFLPGHEGAWIDDQRRRLEQVLVRALECTAEWGLRTGEAGVATAERAARQLVALSPYRESGYLRLMEALATQGNAAEALHVYDDVRCKLRDELGAVPGRPLQMLHGRLLRGGARV